MAKSKLFSDYWRVSKIATHLSVPRTSLHAAVDRGEVPSVTTACGEHLVLESDVIRWMANPMQRGKPRTWELI